MDNQHVQICYNKIHFSYLLSLHKCQKRPPTCSYRCMYMLGLFEKTRNNSVWRMLHRYEKTFGSIYTCYNTFSLHNKPAVHMPAGKLVFEMEATSRWIAFHCLSPEWKLRNPVSFWQHSSLQLAVEHMPESTDRWKIKNTASHIVHTHNGFFPGSKVGVKLAKNYIYCVVKEWVNICFISLYVFMGLRENI
jgi:hypothetical protein